MALAGAPTASGSLRVQRGWLTWWCRRVLTRAAATTPMEGVAGDRFALDGSLCVHAGYSNATALGEPNSAREPRDVVEPGSAPGVWVPL